MREAAWVVPKELWKRTLGVAVRRRPGHCHFHRAYFTDGVGLLVKTATGFKNLKDLSGKRIGVAQSATTKKVIQAVGDTQNLKFEFAEFNSYPEIKAALDSGRVDAFSVDTAILYGYLDKSTSILPERFAPQEYGIASKPGNDALANDTVKSLKASGEIDKLLVKWQAILAEWPVFVLGLGTTALVSLLALALSPALGVLFGMAGAVPVPGAKGTGQDLCG